MGDSHPPTLGSKITEGRVKEGHPTHSQSLESKCQAPLQLSGPVLHSMDISVYICVRWEPDAQDLAAKPTRTPKSRDTASSSGSYSSSERQSRTLL